MKKYLLISRKYREAKRGAYTTSERLVKRYPSYLEHKEDIDLTDLDRLQEEYKRLIFITQSPTMYRPKIDFLKLKNINHIMFIRDEFHPSLYTSASNGFYYYLENSNIEYYIPFITDFPIVDDRSSLTRPCIGVYYRRFLVKDAFKILKSFIDQLWYPVDFYFMGDDPPNIIDHKNVSSCDHTFDNTDFFETITHYLHLVSNDFIDPFPNTVLEAVNCNKQIIFYGNNNRNFRDGIDDLKNIISFHDNYYPDIFYDNSIHPLTFDYFNNFYLKLFENNFEHKFDRSAFNSFIDWIEKEIM